MCSFVLLRSYQTRHSGDTNNDKTPAAVEIVLEAVIILLTGRVMSFQEIRKLLGSGESFLLMMREFRISDMDDHRMQLIGPYVDNPGTFYSVTNCPNLKALNH